MKFNIRRQLSKQAAREGGTVVLGRSSSSLVHAKKAPPSIDTELVLRGGKIWREPVTNPIYPLARHRG